jgi:threonine/homoserine/homoserine lactone efflux protein
MITGMLIEAFLLGLVGGAVPGPILTGAFTEALNTNFFRSTRIIFYALIAETVGALFAIYVIYKIGLSKTAINIISIGGAIVLFWLAYKIWKIDKINTEAKKILTFYEIVILTALNSGYWIFWIAVGVPKALTLDVVILG